VGKGILITMATASFTLLRRLRPSIVDKAVNGYSARYHHGVIVRQLSIARPVLRRTFSSASPQTRDIDVKATEHPQIKTFETENPDLATGEDLKIFFEDFEPGEEIPMVPLPPFDDGSGKVLASPELKSLADRVCTLSFIEIHQLTKLINDHFGFDDSMDFAVGGSVGGADGHVADQAASVEEKTAFDLKLMSYDAKSKIKIIKEVRGIAELGLKEAKELVEGAPKIIKKGIKQEEADDLKAKLEALGAVVEIE
jgi:large subunit ribosomal protein L7/L12